MGGTANAGLILKPKNFRPVMMFAPEVWSQTTRFQKLHHGTHCLGGGAKRALAGITAHYEKCMLLIGLAKKLEPNLKIDNQQLYDRGHTRAIHSKEVAAVIEAAILELYSSVDCTIQVLQTIYKEALRGF